MERLAVAVGGNAIREEAAEPYERQLERAAATASELAAVADGRELLVTHGNGPQVGNRLLEQEAADTPELPLDALVAETQAGIGTCLVRGLAGEGIDAASLVTHSVVDPDDPAFENPEKPIGPYYTAEEAAERDVRTTAVEDDGRAYRRVVASPVPERVVESAAVAALLDRADAVVCGGGGGVPVAEREGSLEGVEAVIDKDHTTRLLAVALDADRLVFLTDVDGVYLDYGAPDERRLDEVAAAELREYHEGGEFPAGSMGPKVEACLAYLDGRGPEAEAVVCALGDLGDALAGDAGTRIYKSRSSA